MDTYVLDSDSLSCLEELKGFISHYSVPSPAAANDRTQHSAAPSSSSIAVVGQSMSVSTSITDDLQHALLGAERSCGKFISELDDILKQLDDVSKLHDEVTGRSNNLMQNCESLLEQQHTLQTTVEVLRKTLSPFTEVEDVSGLLGIPIDARGNPITSQASDLRKVDPRSQEFKSILSRLSKAMKFLKGHPEFLDSERYIHWLYQLQHRATSMVARSMRELLENAAKMCIDIYQKSVQLKSNRTDDTPLESSPVYQKFRGLSFRMKELFCLLRDQVKEDMTLSSDDEQPGQQALNDVMQAYIFLRNQVLSPVVKDTTSIALNGGTLSRTSDRSADIVNLCSGIRQAYSVLIRVSQLENQLYEALFKPLPSTASEGTPDPNVSSIVDHISSGVEVLSIVETLSGLTSDIIRPLIIHEGSVDELCRVINTLAEDVRTQMLAVNLPKPILRALLQGLELTISDAQERLAYCAEIRFRQEIQLYTPSQQNIAYPDILKDSSEKSSSTSDDQVQSLLDSTAQKGLEVVSKTWYPPLKSTLALLSRLYGVVEMSVFEDFARRGVFLCVQALRGGSDQVKRVSSPLHGDLFLVRHLLILREQLIPFEIRLNTVEKHLDWTGTSAAITNLVHNTRMMLRFDAGNAFLQLAWEGIPGMQETEIDAKRDLDNVLKSACSNMKQNALKVLLGPLDSFLAKVTAFVGEIPIAAPSNTKLNLSENASFKSLKSQAFVRSDRVKEMLDTAAGSISKYTEELRFTLQLYVENAVARAILLKPIQQEADLSKRRMETILDACIDDSAPELPQLHSALGIIFSTISSELTH